MRKSANPHLKLPCEGKCHPCHFLILGTFLFWDYRFSEEEAVAQDLFSDEADGDNGGAGFYGEQGGSSYGGGFSAEEWDEDVVVWGVLVGDDADICAASQKGEQLFDSATLWDCLKPQFFSQTAQIAFKERVVKRACDRIEGGREECKECACEIPVSQMRGDKNSGAFVCKRAADSGKVFSGEEGEETLFPNAADVLHFKEGCDEMLIEAFDDFGMSGFWDFWGYRGEVVVCDAAMASVGEADYGGKKRRHSGYLPTRQERSHKVHEANGDVFRRRAHNVHTPSTSSSRFSNSFCPLTNANSISSAKSGREKS